jgi:TRAP-type C4-dicarboxylate transport system permease small subunit
VEKAYVLWRAFQEKILGPVAALIMLGCTLLALLEVVRRYVLGVSFHWQQDAVTYFILTSVFLYFGIAQRRGAHLTVDILTHAMRAFGPRSRRVAEYIEVLAVIFALLFMIGVVWWGLEEVLDSQQYAHILGGRIADPEIARRIRAHLIQLSAWLISAYAKAPA